jgi:hypothetical protein
VNAIDKDRLTVSPFCFVVVVFDVPPAIALFLSSFACFLFTIQKWEDKKATRIKARENDV